MIHLNFFAPLEKSIDDLLELSERISLFESFGYAEKQRLMTIRDNQARALSFGGLIALKETIDKLSHQGNFVIKRDDGGKPKFIYSESGSFSISHSGALSVCLYRKDGDVGVDIEKVRTDRDVRGISKRFFSCAETEYLEKHGYDIEAFYKIWTAKEAIAKFEGRALVGILKGFDTVSSCEKYKLVHYRIRYGGEDYVMCVCGGESIEIINNIGSIETIDL